MTDCPPQLRGDLSKWLCEINTGVYVGQVSQRVREALWIRVCENLKNGRATMVYSTNGEQKMDFRVHNTAWEPVDYDGLKLMRRPLPQAVQPSEMIKPGFSHAAKRQMAQRAHAKAGTVPDSFVVVDLETTGLDPAKDGIIELAAIRIEAGKETQRFAALVQRNRKLPKTVVELTGITDQLLKEQGEPLEQALQGFLAFVGKDRLVGYNIAFDMGFLRSACTGFRKPVLTNRCTDLLNLARRRIYGVPNYQLPTLAKHLELPCKEVRRAQNDCELLLQLYWKLNEFH